ncbi:MAG: FKBP-type peptidyl-prolyl cis-trans isomerase [Bacteroidales bacterium]|nr:FKBP-type peptidyl-prolyl cis-trans isomerase [Bacteroidales bacterium]
MTEAQYNELKNKADELDKVKAQLAETQNKLKAAEAVVQLRTFNDSASYAIGRDVSMGWSSQNLGINLEAAAQSMMDYARGRNTMTDATSRPLLQRFQAEFERRQNPGAEENIAAGEEYMKMISNNKSVMSTPSGLKYLRLKAGNGKHPKATDRVKVHYTGTLINGTKFDSSRDRGEPAIFGLNQVIPGWTEGLQLMDEGSVYRLYIPYNLGYGTRQQGSIPAGSTLVFEVELLEINPTK